MAGDTRNEWQGENDPPKTKRELEWMLWGVGFSRRQAKIIIAKGFSEVERELR